MVYARVAGTGSYLPTKVLSNEELSQTLETSDEWIRSRTGIRARRIAADEEATSDLAVVAAKNALEMAGKRPEDVDLIVLATLSPDMTMPATAAFLQQKLGIPGSVPAFDIGAACAGSVFAVSVADNFIRAGTSRCVLVVGAEAVSRFLDWEDRSTAILFGDAGGAMVLVREEGEHGKDGILHSRLHTDGTGAELLTIRGGGSRYPSREDSIKLRENFLKMQGKEVFKIAVRSLSDVFKAILGDLKLTPSDVDWVIPHQANIRIIDAVFSKVGFPREKVLLNLDKYGNTSAASVPITLDEGVRGGR